LNLHDISAEVLLCTREAMGSATSCQPADTCCRWCLMLEGVVIVAGAMVGIALVEVVVMKALALGVLALADKEYLWLATTLLVLLSLAPSATTRFELSS
jgi:hypothetical protein